VIHFDLPEGSDISNLVYKANRIFDADVLFIEVSPAAPGFHARFSALRRHYTYKIADNNRVLMPLERIDIATWYRPISLELLNEASRVLLGEHDFAAFCKFREGGSTIRRLEKFDWVRDSNENLIGTIVADAFCYQQVRNMVGAIVTVAEGRHEIAWLQSMLANKERVTDSMVFPSNGLTLTQVDYPADSELLARAERTIARRDMDGS
jgi:tRNA pseudouridine38-40 synthase